MKKKLVLSLVMALVVATSSLSVFAQTTETVGNNIESTIVTASDKTIEESIAQKAEMLTSIYGETSVQYALIDTGEITISGNAGVYSRSEDTALTKDTMYGVGSISKMYVTAAVMKLVDDGKINLDTPVIQYIPEFKMVDERYKEITPRMLLNHSSGLMGSSFTSAVLFNDNDTYGHDELLNSLSTQRLKADPGEFSVYCNDGFTLAEILVERVSGISYTEFLHKYFIEPLDMQNTKTPLDTFESAKLAKTYNQFYQGELPTEVLNVIGAGGVYSTAEDLCKFSQVFTGQVKGILSDESVKAMENAEYKRGLWPEEVDNSVGYGLGWDSVNLYPFNDYGITALVKGGDTTGYHSSLVVLPELNMAAAVTSSGGNSQFDQILATDMLLQALKEKGVIDEIKPNKNFGIPVAVSMPKEIEKYSGIYSAGMNQLIKITITPEGILSLSFVGMEQIPPQTLVYTEDGYFTSGEESIKVKIVEEENGNIYFFQKQYAELPGIGQVAVAGYMAQKLEANPLSDEVAAAWTKRNGKMYYIVNEKYSSVTYSSILPVIGIGLTEELPGYMADCKIIDENKAEAIVEIPGMAGRDMTDITIYEENGIEYATARGSIAISEDAIKPIAKGESVCTIQADGYARWYSVGESAANKVITVDVPQESGFVVYDQNGICINNTVISGQNTVTLPENGKVIFIGDAGSVFKISIK